MHRSGAISYDDERDLAAGARGDNPAAHRDRLADVRAKSADLYCRHAVSNGRMRPSRGALSLALLLGGVNAGCMNFRPPPAPLAASVAGDAPTPVWTRKAGRRLAGKVEVQGNTLYAGGLDRKVYAIDLASGDTRWSARQSGMIVGGVLLAGDTLFVATSRPDGHVMALEKTKGKRIWRSSADPVAAPLAMIQGVLVVQTQRGEVLALDPGNGKLRWRRRVGSARGPAVPAGPGALLVSTTDSLFRLSLTDGRVTHRSVTPGAVLDAWLPYNGCAGRGNLRLSGRRDSAAGSSGRLVGQGGRPGARQARGPG